MRRSIHTVTVLTSILAIAACGRPDEAAEPGFETIDPPAADPAATTAPPAEMEPDTIGADTVGGV